MDVLTFFLTSSNFFKWFFMEFLGFVGIIMEFLGSIYFFWNIRIFGFFGFFWIFIYVTKVTTKSY